MLYCCDENTLESLPRPYAADGLPHPERELGRTRNILPKLLRTLRCCGLSDAAFSCRILAGKLLRVIENNEGLLPSTVDTLDQRLF